MLNLGKLSLSYLFESLISYNQVKMKVLALDKIIQIECNVIIFMSVANQEEEVIDNGEIIDVIHEYRSLNVNELEKYELFNYNSGDLCHIIDIYGDYVIKLVCNDISVTELGNYEPLS